MTKNMNISDRVSERRESLDISAEDMAQRLRINFPSYLDIEGYNEELMELVDLYVVKKLVKILQFDLLNLLQIECGFCGQGRLFESDYYLSRPELIQKRREKMRLTQEQLGEKINFYAGEMAFLEKYTAHLESWRIDDILNLANTIDVPPQILFDWICPKCGR